MSIWVSDYFLKVKHMLDSVTFNQNNSLMMSCNGVALFFQAEHTKPSEHFTKVSSAKPFLHKNAAFLNPYGVTNHLLLMVTCVVVLKLGSMLVFHSPIEVFFFFLNEGSRNLVDLVQAHQDPGMRH